MSLSREHPELLKAQYAAFARQMPFMYFVLLINTWSTVYVFLDLAPLWLSIGCPALPSIICLKRLVFWVRASRLQPELATATRALRRTTILAPVLSIWLVAWALALYPYGDVQTQAYLAFYCALTGIGCIFSMMHLRPAAVGVALIANLTLSCFFAFTGERIFVAMASNLFLATLAMLAVLQCLYQDFTRLVEAQRQAAALSDQNFRMASIDALTSLPNRRAFFAELDRIHADAAANGGRIALGMLDLDGFKPVNDLYGHAVGDRMLVEVGRRLRLLAETTELYISRLGGDEFALILRAADSDAAVQELGDRICAILREPYRLGDTSVIAGASLGLSIYPDLAGNASELVERADFALYQGKRTRRGIACLFSSRDTAQMHRAAQIEQALRAADLGQELEAHFQPIVDLVDQRVVGFEVLARWTSPLLGRVSPAEFVPVAERAGIISDLTHELLPRALAAAQRWPGRLRVSFNLSAHDLNSRSNVERLLARVDASGFDPKLVDFEITETAIIHNMDQVQAAVRLLRAHGCGISLDDFGTGYSSLTHLHALPLSKIKIDRSFVTNVQQQQSSYQIVKSLLALSRDMGLGCIVEGVETASEVEALRSVGGTLVQGYYFSRPLPEAEVDGFLEEFAKRPSGDRRRRATSMRAHASTGPLEPHQAEIE